MRPILYNVIQKVFNFDRAVNLISMKYRLLFLLTVVSLSAYSQAWSKFLDSSRAIDWRSGVGFSIPSYTTNCSTQPTLLTGSGNAAANATVIQNALASCDATHNVVNLPAGSYYVNNFTYGSQGHQVLRGAGPNSTYIYSTGTGGACNGYGGAICMISSPAYYTGSPSSPQLNPGGSNACSWSSGYSQGSTTIGLTSCGSAPPLNHFIFLDQANDNGDTGGIYLCNNDSTPNCTYKPSGSDEDGRVINGVTYSEKQGTLVTGVTSNGGGSYTVTISPGVYFSNIRSGQSPGAWWPGFVQNDGIENLTVDYSQSTGGSTNADAITMYACYQCWVRNVRSIDAARNHVAAWLSAFDVVRDSYFYQSQAHSSVSYGIEPEQSSALLVENNIFQQVTFSMMQGNCSGCVIGYNLDLDNIWTGGGSFLFAADAGHNAGNGMDLYEGNMFAQATVDDGWGSSDQTTLYRNAMPGWQGGLTGETLPVLIRAWSRDYNFVGNILGQPGYPSRYQVYATSATAGVNLGSESGSIYSFGTADSGGSCDSQKPPCDGTAFGTMMRWGNYDTFNNATQWNTTEASPSANTYVNANFTSSYFSTISHTLPASLYYSSAPSWWPSSKAWPPIGPDVSSGNVGTCTGTYSGAQATNASQCKGGTLSTAWASHVTSIPAEDCYLNTMGGPPDGSGGVLNFDANTCYTTSGIPAVPPTKTAPSSPTGLTATVR